MAAVVITYPLEEFYRVLNDGFEYKISKDVFDTISVLSMKVGAPDYIKTPVFKKHDMKPKHHNKKKESHDINNNNNNNNNINNNNNNNNNNKLFTVTKMDTKTGIMAEFDCVRSFINKLTDKNYNEMSIKITDTIKKMVIEHENSQLLSIGSIIFDIASSNRYYSKIYAQLYAELHKQFDFIQFNEETILEKIRIDILYVDPNENYDKFCQNNKLHEKRKALVSFYVNLMNYHVVEKSSITQLTHYFLEKVVLYIDMDNKKNEVDEITDLIALLYKKEYYTNTDHIHTILSSLSKRKVKETKSLTTKSLFVYMDLNDM